MACGNHPSVDETHACTSCEARWCSGCIKQVGLSHRFICPTCGHLVTKAGPQRPQGGLIPNVVERALSLEGMTTAAGFAVAFALSDWLGFFVIIYLAALVAYYFTIIHHVGDGQPGLPGPSDAADDWFATAGYATRGILCVAFGLAPLFVWVIAKHSVPSPQMILLLLAAGQVLMPAVLLAVAFSNTSLAVIYPVAWIQIIARAPLAYLRFAAIWMASIGFGLAIYVGTVAAFGRLGIIGMFGSAFVWSLFWFAQASLVGNFLRANAPAYGWD